MEVNRDLKRLCQKNFQLINRESTITERYSNGSKSSLKKRGTIIISNNFKEAISNYFIDNFLYILRPLDSHGFTVCHTVSLPFSRSHGRFFISHGFTNFKWIFSQTHNFVRKQTRQPSNSIRQHKHLPKKYRRIVLYIQKINKFCNLWFSDFH